MASIPGTNGPQPVISATSGVSPMVGVQTSIVASVPGPVPALIPASVATQQAAQVHISNAGAGTIQTSVIQPQQQVIIQGQPAQAATIQAQNVQVTNTIPQASMAVAGPSRVASGSSYPVAGGDAKVLDKKRLQELVKEVDPLEQLDEDVEEMLLQIADDFIDNVVTSACQIAKHRKANSVEVKDVQLHLERNWNMWIPGFGSEELKPIKKSATTEAHKQRMALIRKTLKKS